MQPWPDTRDTLLMRLQDSADRHAWNEFTRLYEPLIFRFAVRCGLQEADARDITQQVLCSVAQEFSSSIAADQTVGREKRFTSDSKRRFVVAVKLT